MGGTNCYIAYVLGDGSTKGCFQFWNGFPTGFGQRLVDFLKQKTPDEIENFAKLMDKINWVEEDAKFDLEWQDHYLKLDYQWDHLFIHREILARLPDTDRVPYAAEIDQRKHERQLHDRDWQSLLAAFRNRHSETWESITSGNLHHLVLYHYPEEDDHLDYCYYIDFRKRMLEIEFFRGNKYAFASFDALMEDPNLLGRIEKKLEKWPPETESDDEE